MFYKSKNIYTTDRIIDGYIEVEAGIIKGIYPSDYKVDKFVDYSNYRIIPGIFDTHNHGTMGYPLMGECEDYESEVKGYLKGLAAQGVSSILPTADITFFETIAKLAPLENDGAKIIGIHSEGPYLNRVGEKGIDTGHPDIDINYLQTMIDKAGGYLKLVGMAPELKGSEEATKFLLDKGVRVAFTHSNCNYQEANEAFKRGVSVSTHTANVMSGIHHRNMGGLGACLLNEDVWCEIICDGLHVSLEMLQLMFKVKPYSKFMMISDSTPMAGAGIGRYSMNGFMEVNINTEGYCLTDTGRLCGSSKSVLYGVSNLVEKLHIDMHEVLKMCSLNPAIVYGVSDRKGSIEVGKDSDFVVIDQDYNVIATYSEGRQVYDKDKDGDVFNAQYTKKYKLN